MVAAKETNARRDARIWKQPDKTTKCKGHTAVHISGTHALNSHNTYRSNSQRI